MDRREIERRLDDIVRRRDEAAARQRALSDELAATVKLARDAGMPMTEIAERLRVSRQAVYDILKR